MDLWKFINLLDVQALWFSRLDVLQKKERFEGIISSKTIENDLNFLMKKYPDAEKRIIEDIKTNDQWSKCLLVNCWGKGEDEDIYKWKNYLECHVGGIAIQTTYEKFKKCFSENKYNVYSANVNYIDFEKEPQPTEIPPFRTVLYKNKSFIWEQELRVVVTIGNAYQGEQFGVINNITENGIYIKVNLDELIDNIYLSPKTTSSFIKTIKNLLTNYKIYKEIKKSKFSVY